MVINQGQGYTIEKENPLLMNCYSNFNSTISVINEENNKMFFFKLQNFLLRNTVPVRIINTHDNIFRYLIILSI